MSFTGTDDHKQSSRSEQGRNRNYQNQSRYSGFNRGGGRGRNYNQRGQYYNPRGQYYNGFNRGGGRGRNYNQRQYNNNNRMHNMNQNHCNNRSTGLQVRSSRFSRPKNTDTTGYQSRRNDNKYLSNTNTYTQPKRPSFDTHAFPNDWDHENTPNVRKRNDFGCWKASKPKIKYYTSDSQIYPDRVGVPQICSRGPMDDIINKGCTFASEHYQIHPSLLPGSITIMLFKKENSAFCTRRHGDPNQNLQDGSQIRLKYSIHKFFQILWINAKQNKHFGIEIPELGWKLAAIDKFRGSMKRHVGGTLQMALKNEYINQDKYNELIQYFKTLNEDFHVNSIDLDHESGRKNKLNTQHTNCPVETTCTDEYQEIMNNDATTSTKDIDDLKCTNNDENDEDLIRNAKEATDFFSKNNYKLNNAEPRFTKVVEEDISADYLRKKLPNELKHLYKTAIEISDLLSYEWRIGVDFGENTTSNNAKQISVTEDAQVIKDQSQKPPIEMKSEKPPIEMKSEKPPIEMKSEIYIEFYSGRKENRFEVWAQLKQKLNIDKEGGDNTYESEVIGKQCAEQYYELMKKVYSDQKTGLLKVHKSEKEYMDNVRLLKELKNCVPVLYFPPHVADSPYVRPSKFKNNWWECCVKYNYPGREILDKVKLISNTNEDDMKNELSNLMEQHTIETPVDDNETPVDYYL